MKKVVSIFTFVIVWADVLELNKIELTNTINSPTLVSICVRAGLPKPRGVPDTERTKDTKTLDYASTPLDANTVLAPVPFHNLYFNLTSSIVRSSLKGTPTCEPNI